MEGGRLKENNLKSKIQNSKLLFNEPRATNYESRITSKIKKAIIEKKVKNKGLINRISSFNIPIEFVEKPNFDISLTKGKQILYITENPGKFLKKCPGTPIYICCEYYVLHLAEHCPMDCSYCILQTYFKNPYLTVFANYENMIKEIEQADREGEIVRVGTGEFTDSLALAEICGWHDLLIPVFSTSKNMFLEIKSKLADLSFLRFKEHNRKIIASWSLNTQKIQKSEELFTDPIEKRIKAAKIAMENGFINSFHFDPIIYYENCEKEYKETVNLIFDNIDDKNICWISLGSLRFIPSLKEISTERFKKSKIFYQEFHTALDGKKRYFITRRIQLYKAIYNAIRKRSKIVPVYFCMENDKVWKEVMGFSPEKNENLKKYLDEAIIRVSKQY